MGLLGHVISDLKNTVGCGSLGVDDSFWNSLTGKMSEFIEKVEVLEEDWAVRTSSQGVLVVIEGCAGRGGDQLWVGGLHS